MQFIVYASARDGWASLDYNEKADNMKALLDTIVEYIPTPAFGSFKILISTTDYNEYMGR